MDMIVKNSRYYIFKNEILNSYFEFRKEIDNDILLKIFIVINKHYPSFLISRIDFIKITELKKWEDVILDKLKITSEHDLSMDLIVPLYYPLANDFSKNSYGLIEDSMHIYYGFDNEHGKSFFAINFYGNLYTDVVCYWHAGPDPDFVNVGGKYLKHNISEIAFKNRASMRSLLIELESLLEGEIVEYLSHHLDQKDINKYGIYDDAIFR